MAEQTGFAVVGLGMGLHHCKAIDAAPGAHLVAVCDTERAWSHTVNMHKGIDFAELLADDEIQLSTCNAFGYARRWAYRQPWQVALIVEKPADIQPERVDQLITAEGKRRADCRYFSGVLTA